MIKRDLCDFINNKRLIYVKNISPKASISLSVMSLKHHVACLFELFESQHRCNLKNEGEGRMKVCGVTHVRVYYFPVRYSIVLP